MSYHTYNTISPRAFRWTIGVGLVVLALSVLWLIVGREALLANPAETDLEYNFPVYATDDSEGNIYVVDTSRRRVTRRLASGEIDLVIEGGSRVEDEFFYAEHIAIGPEGDLYLHNIVNDLDGYYIEREEILRYSPDGTLRQVVHREQFSEGERNPALVQRGRISSLYSTNEGVGWILADGTGIEHIRFSSRDSHTEQLARFSVPNADMHHADVAPVGDDGAVVYSRKDGTITLLESDGSEQTVYTAPRGTTDVGRPHVVPWELAVGADGTLYFIDLEHRAIRRLAAGWDEEATPDYSTETKPGIVLDQEVLADSGHDVYEFNYYRLKIGGSGALMTTNDEAAVRMGPDGQSAEYITGGRRDPRWRVLAWGNWVAMLLSAIALIVIARSTYIHVLDRSLPPVLLKTAGVVTVVAIAAVVVTSVVIPNLTERHESLMLEKIGGMQQIIPRTVDGDLFHEIRGVEDYGSEAYHKIREGFLEALNYNQDPWNESYYFALYREIDGRLYGFMFLNGQIGMFHPYDWIGYDGVYDEALAGDVATVVETDIAGDWMYGVSPIYDSEGEIVALFETGTDLFAFNVANRLLVEQLVLEILTTLVVLVILMIEITVLADMLGKRRRVVFENAGTPPAGYSDVMLTRPISFFVFGAVSISLSYLPLLARDLYTPVGELSREFLIALPLSAEMLAFGVVSLLLGLASGRLRWQQSVTGGLLLTAAGLVASALADDLAMLVAARAVAGLGSGTAYFGLRSLVNSEARREERSQGFSHLYSGMTAGISAGVVLGGSVADRVGFSTTFYAGLVFIAAAAVFFVLRLRTAPLVVQAEQRAEPGRMWRDLARFITNGRVWAFFLMLVIPTYIAGTFLGYFFPLFAEAEGFTAGDIGRWWIVNGLMIVYLGPPLSRFFHRRVGQNRAAIIGSALWGGSLIFFALTGSLAAAIVTLVVMGITEGFCVTAQNDVYLELDISKQVGEDRAVGYFELFSKLGETVGPIAFSVVLQLGAELGMAVLGAGVLLIALPFIPLAPRTPRTPATEGT